MSKRQFGILISWTASASGGFGYIDASDGARFFLQRRCVLSGDPRPGSRVVFEVLPPVTSPTAKFPRAINATINSHTPEARIPPKVPTNAVTSSEVAGS
jgi:hypothetical protein